MKKALILGIALLLVVVSGGLFSAQAGCFSWLSPCNWSSPCAGTSQAAAAPAPAPDYSWRPNPCSCGLSWLSPCCWHLSSTCGCGK
jgi:hypothetical protein